MIYYIKFPLKSDIQIDTLAVLSTKSADKVKHMFFYFVVTQTRGI